MLQTRRPTPPWGELGAPVSGRGSVKEILKDAGLDWKVELHEIFAKIEDTKIPVDDKWLLVRRSTRSSLDKTMLSIVGPGFQPTQNYDAFERFQEFLGVGAEMKFAGDFKDGKRVWALAKINDLSFSMFSGQDETEAHLLFSLPHIYGARPDIRFVPVRKIGMTTQVFSLVDDKSDLEIALSKGCFDPAFCKGILHIVEQKMAQYKQDMRILTQRHYTRKMDSLHEFLMEVYPWTGRHSRADLSKAASQAFEVLEDHPGCEFAPRTWFNAYQACLFTADHLLGRGDDSRLEAAWYGLARRLKLNALKLALKYAKRAD